MTVADAQLEVRAVFFRGSVGQLVSGAVWLLSAVLSTWVGTKEGIIALVAGGVFLYPFTQLVLWLLGGRCALSRENPLRQLAIQVAFIVPFTLPVVGGAALHNLNWFYPGCMIVVGAHYMPFIFLYGMWQFGVLAAALMVGGYLLATMLPNEFALGGWLAAAAMLLFGGYAAVTTWRARPAVTSPKGQGSRAEFGA